MRFDKKIKAPQGFELLLKFSNCQTPDKAESDEMEFADYLREIRV